MGWCTGDGLWRKTQNRGRKRKKGRKKSVGGRGGYLAQGENFQVKFSVNSMFLRYDIIMLIFLLLIPGCDLLVGLDVMDYWFIFAEFVHVRRCSV